MQVRKKKLELDIEQNRLVPNGERSTSRLYIVTCLFNLYAEYLIRNTRLGEAQARVKIARKNINNLRYADNTTLMKKAKRNQRPS